MKLKSRAGHAEGNAGGGSKRGGSIICVRQSERCGEVCGAGDRVQCNSLPGQPTSPQGHCRCSRDSIHDPQLGTIFDFPYVLSLCSLVMQYLFWRVR